MARKVTGYEPPYSEGNPGPEYIMPPAQEIVDRLRMYGGDLVGFLRSLTPSQKNRQYLLSAIREELGKIENRDQFIEWERLILDFQMNSIQLLEGVFWLRVNEVANNLAKESEETREIFTEAKRIGQALSASKNDIGKRLEALALFDQPEPEPDTPKIDPEKQAAEERLNAMMKAMGYKDAGEHEVGETEAQT